MLPIIFAIAALIGAGATGVGALQKAGVDIGGKRKKATKSMLDQLGLELMSAVNDRNRLVQSRLGLELSKEVGKFRPFASDEGVSALSDQLLLEDLMRGKETEVANISSVVDEQPSLMQMASAMGVEI